MPPWCTGLWKVMRGTYQKQPAFALEIQNRPRSIAKAIEKKKMTTTFQSRIKFRGSSAARIVKCVACRLPIFTTPCFSGTTHLGIGYGSFFVPFLFICFFLLRKKRCWMESFLFPPCASAFALVKHCWLIMVIARDVNLEGDGKLGFLPFPTY